MDRLSDIAVKYKKSIVAVFLILALLSGILSLFVSVNFNIVDYLPQKAQSTKALDIMEKEFKEEMPNARVMIKNVTIQEALEYKEKISGTEGISSVGWLDDVIGTDILTTTPIEFIDDSLLDNYYKNGNALITATVESGLEESTIKEIKELIGPSNAVDGEAVNRAETQEMSISEVLKAMAILVPVIVIILAISTTSWIEPLLFLVTIGIAITINMGTNVFFKDISFITQAISPILQLAVSLDYAIFLLHSFKGYLGQFEPEDAMKLAIKHALPTVAASAATTLVGFLALVAMRFEIGSDLGINLVKGILLSFISVMVFLPALTLLSYKLIEKTKHRKPVPKAEGIGQRIIGIRMPFLILAIIIVVPGFLAQANTQFMYGTGGVAEASRVGKDAALIENEFGKENTLVLLVPREDVGREAELCTELKTIPHVKNVLSYTSAVGAEIPVEFVPNEAVDQFYSENYTRLILYIDTKDEGEEAFCTVESISDTAEKYYDTCYMAGQSATLYDMKNIVSIDTKLVNIIAIIGIFIVLLLTFRSLTVPLLLLFSIETAIWINLSYAYFADQHLNFVGYLVISTVQLGATVDYAILLTNRYLANRKKLSKEEAMKVTIDNNLAVILTSASILSIAGFILSFTSTNPIISELGMLLGRGTVLSFIMVICVLPALLLLFDRVIQKTTLNDSFYEEENI
ncbi:MAG TPA: MMPL family transporter [Clostridia bacterium]|nr:MMPL family transporter [Clostridia bacterium]